MNVLQSHEANDDGAVLLLHDHISKQMEQSASDEVLLLLSGGSSAMIGVRALLLLDRSYGSRLHVGLTDERYAEYLHTDSNWKTLCEAGLPTDRNFVFHPVITPTAYSMEDTARNYEETLKKLFQNIPHVVALFGIGEDDHIAGILPSSPASHEEERFVISYDGGKFKRITITPPVFSQISFGMVYAKGKSKEDAVMRLHEPHDVVTHPDQLIHKCSRNAIYFSHH